MGSPLLVVQDGQVLGSLVAHSQDEYGGWLYKISPDVEVDVRDVGGTRHPSAPTAPGGLGHAPPNAAA